MDQVKLWRLINGRRGGPAAQEILQQSQTETEKLLEDALLASPDLLVEGLCIIGRQCETQGGPLDLLGLDEEGRLVVFELKRGMLRRDAVAQAVDYASFLSGLTDDQLSHFIEQNSKRLKDGAIENFSTFYTTKFPKAVADIGKPRIVLVGIGADAATKRMVNFLAEGGLDIAIITFHAFVDEGKTYLAKQVETRSPSAEMQANKNTKAGNQAELSALLKRLGLESTFESVAAVIARSFGATCYQWPNPSSYVFSRMEATDEGQSKRRNLLTLYVDSARRNQVRLYLQPRAVAHAGLQNVKDLAASLNSSVVETPAGYLYFWVDVAMPNLVEACNQLANAIAAGANRASDEALAEEIDPNEA